MAGNIGATQVQSAAGVLEKSIRDRAAANDVEAAKQQVAAALDPLVGGLQARWMPTASEVSAVNRRQPPADPAQSREAAAHLTALLSEC